MDSSDEDYKTPEWITEEFLQDVLKEYFKNDSLEISNVIVKSALHGDCGIVGIASQMHRATMNLKKNNSDSKFSVIIKEHPKGSIGVVAHRNQLFTREIKAYKEVLPRIKELLVALGDTTKIAPECYYATETPEPFLILEDMCLSGFCNFERQRLLNLEYALLTIRKLAKLHACSMYLAEQNPKLLEFFNSAHFNKNVVDRSPYEYYTVNIRCAAEEISDWEGYEEIAAKLLTFAGNAPENATNMYNQHKNGYKVFNMADLWIDNLMFLQNKENNEPEDVVMIDFQLSYYGSPAMDLNYFLYGSINENVRKVHLKYIVREYCDTLKATLNKLNYKGCIPSVKDISIEMIKNSFQSIVATTCLTPIVFMNHNGFGNVAKLTNHAGEGDALRRENLRNSKYRTFLQRTIKEFELNGFLE